MPTYEAVAKYRSNKFYLEVVNQPLNLTPDDVDINDDITLHTPIPILSEEEKNLIKDRSKLPVIKSRNIFGNISDNFIKKLNNLNVYTKIDLTNTYVDDAIRSSQLVEKIRRSISYSLTPPDNNKLIGSNIPIISSPRRSRSVSSIKTTSPDVLGNPENRDKNSTDIDTSDPLNIGDMNESFRKFRNFENLNFNNSETQIAFERKILESSSSCSEQILDRFRTNLAGLTPINNLSLDNTYQNYLSCLTDAIIAKDLPGLLSTYLQDIISSQLISNVSAYGDTYKLYVDHNPLTDRKLINTVDVLSPVDVEISHPLFVAKAVKNSSQFYHEGFLGILGLNNLRVYFPTFMYTYAVFEASPPIGDVLFPNLNIDRDVTYLLLENISNSISLETFLTSDISDKDFKEVLLQIIQALNLAYNLYDFTHYDMNAKNILIQVLDEEISFPYYGDEFYTETPVVKYFTTRYIARIIDFGLSHIQISNSNFGVFGYEKYKVYAGKSFPYNDVHRLVCECGLQTNNSSILNFLKQIYKTFGSKITFEQRIQTAFNIRTKGDSDFFVPENNTKTINFSDIINMIVKDSIEIYDNPVHDTICNDCTTLDTFTGNLFDKRKSVNSMLELYYMIDVYKKNYELSASELDYITRNIRRDTFDRLYKNDKKDLDKLYDDYDDISQDIFLYKNNKFEEGHYIRTIRRLAFWLRNLNNIHTHFSCTKVLVNYYKIGDSDYNMYFNKIRLLRERVNDLYNDIIHPNYIYFRGSDIKDIFILKNLEDNLKNNRLAI